jgi:hypothetical protein
LYKCSSSDDLFYFTTCIPPSQQKVDAQKQIVAQNTAEFHLKNNPTTDTTCKIFRQRLRVAVTQESVVADFAGCTVETLRRTHKVAAGNRASGWKSSEAACGMNQSELSAVLSNKKGNADMKTVM